MRNDNKKQVLMHICCAPCFIAPYRLLSDEGEYEVTGFWFNDNIHPYREYQRRLDTFLEWSSREGLSCLIEKEYKPEPFFRRIAGREAERCFLCYHFRLTETAERAKAGVFDAFSTTLLSSVYQKHDLIKRTAEEIAQRKGIAFYYRDFRELWREGIELSKKENMYRQPYCGCLYSEKDRYDKG
jgi:hypothetical protein